MVVYFAGHGFVQNGKGYLAPWDVDPDKLETTAYPMATLGDVLANKVNANWKVLLTDACHSGKINAETTNEALERQFSALPTSFLTLTATTEREQSFEDPNLSTGYGFFTYFLVQAFRGYADSDPVRWPHHGRRADRIRPLERPPLRPRAPVVADADGARRLRARHAARRGPGLHARTAQRRPRCSAPPSSNPTWTTWICISMGS